MYLFLFSEKVRTTLLWVCPVVQITYSTKLAKIAELVAACLEYEIIIFHIAHKAQSNLLWSWEPSKSLNRPKRIFWIVKQIGLKYFD